MYCVFWLGIVASSLSFTGPAWGLINPTAGLKHHWALDESSGLATFDSAGSQPGTLVNGPLWQPALGRIDGALEFDGVDDHVSLGTMDVPTGTGLTIGIWIKADDFDVTDGRLISKSTGLLASDHYWMVSTINSTGLRFRLKTGGSTTTLATSTGQISTGKWYHVAVTYDGVTMRIYKDGVEVASAPKTGAINTSAGVGVAIGGQPAGAGSAPFDGLIDDVRMYNRALTPLEVSGMAGDPTITLWYGDSLKSGYLGVPQKWANVVGTVTGASRVDSLYYRLNGGAAAQLTIGPDGYRLVGEGDFNIELNCADLDAGSNDVAITAVDIFGQRTDTTVTVNYMNGVKWARPDTLKFESASKIADEAYVIDGQWHLESGGVRNNADAIGYDRLLTAGEGYDAGSSWPSDLDVTAPITIHNYLSNGSYRGAVGIGLGWKGHNGPEQPAKGHKYQV
ncbi:MAG: LamG domain-containing protein, partial [Gemmatimonadales bacterium]|nr:LamG domain-containing protein [Gemmatimonadales bacterium]